ncbi:MAG TPA: efflux RND transporter periplasmic adaptor subunit [Verrucomicrobiales bacterium]|nr:efflux RND transporter periplasmic adaptor subunit [Verrucomicrobiales bacterium]
MRRKKKNTKWKWVVGFGLVGLMVSAVIKFKPKQDTGIISVQIHQVERRDITEIVVANGRIQPVKEVKISPEVSGEIIELPVKEGQEVSKGDLLLKIRPDLYVANRNSAQAGYNSSQAGFELQKAHLKKAEADFRRSERLYKDGLETEDAYQSAQTSLEVSQLQVKASSHQVEQSKASLNRAEEDLAKATIYSPISGTVTMLGSELGERVLGTAQNMGTIVMNLANLNEMEARVEISEIDIVRIKVNQLVSLEVDAFRNRKFNGMVSEIGNSATTSGSGQQEQATRFEVVVLIEDKESFRPGMSITAHIETESRTNVIAVPIQCVTTRQSGTESPSKTPSQPGEHQVKPLTKSMDDGPEEIVFLAESDKAKQITVTRGISDDEYVEIIEGLKPDDQVISGGYKAIHRELKDGSLIKTGEEKKLPQDQ